jgi:radical SAM protein with 4Fe4S-binding SPASM domain
MVSYAKTNNIFVSTSTNGHFLNPANAKKTVKSGLDRIIISLDGLDQETYEKYRVGGDFNTVIQGIKNLVAAKKKLQSTSPFIVVQFIVFKTNEHQLNQLDKLKKELKVDKIELKTAQVYSSDDKNLLIPDNSKLSRYRQNEKGKWEIKGKLPNKCKRMWQAAVITWDGNVSPCCFDKDANYKMGNILESSFQEIKLNKEYSQFRNQVFTNRSQIDICRNCSEGL